MINVYFKCCVILCTYQYILKYLKYDIARCRQTKVERPSFVVVSKVSNNSHASGKSKDSCTEKKTVNNLVSVVYGREHMLKILFYDNVYLKFIDQLRLHWFLLLLGCCCFSFIFLEGAKQAMPDSLMAISQYGICQDYSYTLP